MDHPTTDLQIVMTLILWAALEALEGEIEPREALLLISEEARAGLLGEAEGPLSLDCARQRVCKICVEFQVLEAAPQRRWNEGPPMTDLRGVICREHLIVFSV